MPPRSCPKRVVRRPACTPCPEGYKTAEIAAWCRRSLLVAQYKGAPDVTRKRLWLETVQDVLAKNRKVVGGDGRQLIYVPMTDAAKAMTPTQALLPDLVSPAVQATEQATEQNSARPARSGRPAGRGGAMKFPAWMAAVVAALVLLMGSMFVVSEETKPQSC